MLSGQGFQPHAAGFGAASIEKAAEIEREPDVKEEECGVTQSPEEGRVQGEC